MTDAQAAAAIVHDVVNAIVLLALLAGVFLYAAARLPADNPLKRILTALSLRLGATIAAGVAIPIIEPIPVLDVAYDVGVPLALAYFWLTLIREIVAIFRETRRPASAPARIAFRQATPKEPPQVIEGELLPPDGERTDPLPRLPR